MSMLDAFFNKGFKAAKCKTLLKLTIPRIKLLRNRREIQIKQMRRDIAKLLETGQEATARIRVEHIIREENMMAAQEILELFCELIAVRLPIIETQRECPLDLKEAISSVCFAAPRCADLPELQQVQMLFGSKYGREFISAAAELMPDCGVNRQIIELLSVRAPQPDVKLKLLKEIAEEHELDWDPAASETEYFKQPEDLLNGSTQFVNQSKVPLPKEKYDETAHPSTIEVSHEQADSDSEWDSLGLPEVPKVSLRPLPGGSVFEAPPPPPQAPLASEFDLERMKHSVGGSGLEAHPQAPLTSEFDHEPMKHSAGEEDISNDIGMEPTASVSEKFVAPPDGSPEASVHERNDKQFSPFISFPPSASASFSVRQSQPPVALSRTKSDLNVDLQDVLAAAHAAAESAERAAASARSAANLATVRITELMKKNHKNISDSSEHLTRIPNLDESPPSGMPQFDHQTSFSNTDHTSYAFNPPLSPDLNLGPETPSPLSYDKPKMDFDSPSQDNQVPQSGSAHHQPKRLPSMEDDPYFSYPNLFTTQGANTSSNSVDKL